MEKGSYIVGLLFVILHTVSSQSLNECYTPDELIGECINIKRCPSLLMLFENPKKNSSVAEFLHNSKCGYEGRDPKLCCALVNDPSGSSNQTTSPQTSTEKINFSIKLPSLSTCGRSNSTHTRIVGGSPADLGVWPWMAALGYQDRRIRKNGDYKWLCGGSLISDSYVLTAAHCLTRDQYRRLVVVRLGDLNLNPSVQDSASPIDMPVSFSIVHRGYNSLNYTNDIGILKLVHPVTFNEFIQPICLPILRKHKINQLTNMVVFVAGWGTTSFKGSTSNALIEIQLPVWDNVDCKQTFTNEKNVVIDDRVICAGVKTGGKDACQQDSGGPLMWPDENQYYLMGVVSYGYKCGKANHPGVYTRVTHFVDWIVDKIDNSLDV